MRSKNQAAVALGSLGGKARAKSLPKDRMRSIAQGGARARWKSHKPAPAIQPDQPASTPRDPATSPEPESFRDEFSRLWTLSPSGTWELAAE